ncbi:MAG: amidohydrolase [Pseudomonadales bacterium]|nr:amidohydrolase [Pseudomonadales bacterium]MCP5184044.1 amidohydrolase [Pseudomonadales bacterium]
MTLRVFTARTIRTMNPSLPEATAVAVKDGMIVEVGTLDSLQPWLSRHDHVVDERFADKVLMPGFIDPHLHPSLGAILLPMHFITALEWRLPDRVVAPVVGHAAYLDRLSAIEADMPANEPLHTWGYHHIWHGRITRTMINAISAMRPILVWQRSYHEIVMNDAAIDWLKFDRERLRQHPQVDAEAGRFYESGKLMATARMMGYLTDPERFRHGLSLVKAAIHAGGHTTIGDLTGGYFDTDDEWEAMRDVLDTPDTPFRVQMIPVGTRPVRQIDQADAVVPWLKERASRSTARLFYRDHVKLFMDGAFFAELMQVQPPGYIDGHHGEWMFPPELTEAVARACWNAGYRIHVHCTGDLGLELALDILEKLQFERPRVNHRFTIEHFGLSTPEQVRRIADLGAIVSANVYYLHELGEAYWQHSIGHERASQMARLGTVARHNVTTALHSDFTMAPALPLFNAWVAINRVSEAGNVLGATERLTVEQAMRAITIDAAYVLGMEHEVGSIRAGKKADFTVLEQDPFTVDPMTIKDIPVWGTVFEGMPFPRAS